MTIQLPNIFRKTYGACAESGDWNPRYNRHPVYSAPMTARCRTLFMISGWCVLSFIY